MRKVSVEVEANTAAYPAVLAFSNSRNFKHHDVHDDDGVLTSCDISSS